MRSILRDLFLLIFGWLKTRGSSNELENRTSMSFLRCREKLPWIFQWWHPSILVSIIINVITKLSTWYRLHYYYLFEPTLFEQEASMFKKNRKFHLWRRFFFFLFLLIIFVFYNYNLNNYENHLVYYSANTICFLVIISLGFFLLLDNMLGQCADIITLIDPHKTTLLSLLLCHDVIRTVLFESRNRFQQGEFGNISENDFNEENSSRNSRLMGLIEEHVEEVHIRLKHLKSELLRLNLLPLRHIIGILIIWCFLVLSLQIYWNNGAFLGLELEKRENRNFYTFVTDTLDCMYFSFVTVSTLGYGATHPATAGDFSKKVDYNSNEWKAIKWARFCTSIIILTTIVLILGTFGFIFNSVNNLMWQFRQREKIYEVIRDFIVLASPHPIVY